LFIAKILCQFQRKIRQISAGACAANEQPLQWRYRNHNMASVNLIVNLIVESG
jgi:hypothetical protein